MNQIEYQSYEQSDEYRPFKANNTIPQLDREFARQAQAERDYAAQLAQNNRTTQLNAQNSTEDLKALGAFSQTLTNYLEDETKRYVEREMTEGLMQAYNEGLPQEQIDQFREEEQALRDDNTDAEAAAVEVTQVTGDPLAGAQVRNLSGWRAYGYARGRVQMAAMNFPAYYQSAKGTIQIEVDGRIIGFDSPDLTSAEYAALQQELISGYMSNFAGVNPALLNEYLFPTVSRYTAGETATWAAERAQEMEQEAKEQRLDDLVVDVLAGNSNAASNYILNHPEGPRKGKQELAEVLEQGLANGTIDPDLVEQIVFEQEITFNDGSTGTLAERDPRIFGGLRQSLEDTRDNNITRDEREIRRDEREFTNGVKGMANDGHIFSPKEIDEIENWFTTRGMAVPAWVTNLTTSQILEDADARTALDTLIRDRGYLYEQDLELASPTVRAEYQPYVDAGTAVQGISDTETRQARELIESALLESFDIQDPDEARSPSFLAAERQLERDYQQYYAEGVVKYGDNTQAHEYALAQIERDVKARGPQYWVNYQAQLNESSAQTIDAGREGIIANTDEDGNLAADYLIPNSESARAQAYDYIHHGRGSLPTLYTTLARGQGFTPRELAVQQLQAANMYHVQDDEQQGDMGISPELQDLLRRYPSNSNTERVVLESSSTGNAKWFLDSIASYESTSYGGYDAMNTGGSGWGVNNTAYGSANSNDVFDRGLSQMSVREVMQLQDSGQVFAAGRYQFIPSTLKETVRAAGIDLDAPFNAATQDQLALARLRWRLGVDNSMNGLMTEWQGLHHMPPAERQRLLETARGLVGMGKLVPSVYNQPEVLVPGLLAG